MFQNLNFYLFSVNYLIFHRLLNMSTEETKTPLYPEVNYGSTQPPPYNQPVINQPQLQNNPLMVTSFEGHREWTTGLFDCLADPATCKSLQTSLI